MTYAEHDKSAAEAGEPGLRLGQERGDLRQDRGRLARWKVVSRAHEDVGEDEEGGVDVGDCERRMDSGQPARPAHSSETERNGRRTQSDAKAEAARLKKVVERDGEEDGLRANQEESA